MFGIKHIRWINIGPSSKHRDGLAKRVELAFTGINLRYQIIRYMGVIVTLDTDVFVFVGIQSSRKKVQLEAKE